MEQAQATMTQLESTLLLVAVFQVKHFICDFPLQTKYMLKKVSGQWDFVPPLALHSAVHAFATALICLWWNPTLWMALTALDFVVHFIMDRIKSGPKYLGRFNDPKKASHWYAFGFDQMVHHLTHAFIVYVLIATMPSAGGFASLSKFFQP